MRLYFACMGPSISISCMLKKSAKKIGHFIVCVSINSQPQGSNNDAESQHPREPRHLLQPPQNTSSFCHCNPQSSHHTCNNLRSWATMWLYQGLTLSACTLQALPLHSTTKYLKHTFPFTWINKRVLLLLLPNDYIWTQISKSHFN